VAKPAGTDSTSIFLVRRSLQRYFLSGCVLLWLAVLLTSDLPAAVVSLLKLLWLSSPYLDLLGRWFFFLTLFGCHLHPFDCMFTCLSFFPFLIDNEL
jgi:hypothetical protein